MKSAVRDNLALTMAGQGSTLVLLISLPSSFIQFKARTFSFSLALKDLC